MGVAGVPSSPPPPPQAVRATEPSTAAPALPTLMRSTLRRDRRASRMSLRLGLPLVLQSSPSWPSRARRSAGVIAFIGGTFLVIAGYKIQPASVGRPRDSGVAVR